MSVSAAEVGHAPCTDRLSPVDPGPTPQSSEGSPDLDLGFSTLARMTFGLDHSLSRGCAVTVHYKVFNIPSL